MIADNGIIIRNIYHMLAYAFRGLRHKSFERIASEKFDHMEDLLAEILRLGIARQVKQGLHRDYLPHEEDLLTVKGKIQIAPTFRLRVNRRQQIHCSFDELSVDHLFNRILKSAGCALLESRKVKPPIAGGLRKVLRALSDVSRIDLGRVRWSSLQTGRQTQTYDLLLNICRLIYLHCLPNEQKGRHRMEQWNDETQLNLLYQRFLLNYFSEHRRDLHPRAAHINWDTEDEDSPNPQLPKMMADVILTGGKQTLIIDAKFYGSVFHRHYNNYRFHSGNLYQIFTYVQNYKAQARGKEVSGMLLYARTQEEIVAQSRMRIHGNMISVLTLDLNCDFEMICRQLDEIANSLY